MGAVQIGFQSDGMIRVPAVFQPFHEDSQQIWTFSAKYLSFSLLCALLRQLLCICIITDETGCAMVILLPWCDFPLPDVTFLYRCCDMGMTWLFSAWCDLSTGLAIAKAPLQRYPNIASWCSKRDPKKYIKICHWFLFFFVVFYFFGVVFAPFFVIMLSLLFLLLCFRFSLCDLFF